MLEHRRQRPVDDQWFHHRLAQHLLDQPDLPLLRVRTDVTARSGESPPCAGVYIRQNDPSVAPQFAWPEKDRGQLVDSNVSGSGDWYYVEIMSGSGQR